MTKAKTLSLFTMSAKFPDEASAVAFFEQSRWGGKPICPHCESADTLPRPRRRGHWCRGCRKDFTVRTGTIYAESRLPLRKWLFAMYLLLTNTKGLACMPLQFCKKLEVTDETALFMLNRLWVALGKPKVLAFVSETGTWDFLWEGVPGMPCYPPAFRRTIPKSPSGDYSAMTMTVTVPSPRG